MIIQRFKPLVSQSLPKNIIIEYEKPKAVAVRHVVEEGVYRVDPTTYQTSTTSNGEVRIVERITDLPIENSRILAQYAADNESGDDEPHISNIEQYLNGQFEAMRMNMTNQSSEHLNSYPANAEYETINIRVSHNVAERIIAEARASGATISRSGSIDL